jgi:heme-degrading monooxygenase HmoA
MTMIKHIVMWRLKDHAEGTDKSENAIKMKALLDACSDIVPGIHSFEVALAKPGYDCTYDVVLYSEFDSLAALEAYQDHPQHVALKPFVGAVRLDRQCMDYEIQ